MKKHILVIPGDGIGPEVTTWGKAVLEKIGKDFGHEFTYDEALLGHAAIEATGSPLPDETLTKAKKKTCARLCCLMNCWMQRARNQKSRKKPTNSFSVS